MNADYLTIWYLIVGMGCSTWAVVFLVARADLERAPLRAWQRIVVLVVCVAGGLVWPLTVAALGVVAARPAWRRRLVGFDGVRGADDGEVRWHPRDKVNVLGPGPPVAGVDAGGVADAHGGSVPGRAGRRPAGPLGGYRCVQRQTVVRPSRHATPG